MRMCVWVSYAPWRGRAGASIEGDDGGDDGGVEGGGGSGGGGSGVGGGVALEDVSPGVLQRFFDLRVAPTS